METKHNHAQHNPNECADHIRTSHINIGLKSPINMGLIEYKNGSELFYNKTCQ